MNFEIATDILGLNNEEFGLKELKKAYYRKCLIHHPDKIQNGSVNNDSMFKKCNEAYEYLSEYIKKSGEQTINSSKYYDGTMSYKQMIKNYILLISEKYKWNADLLHNVFDLILKDAGKISFKLFESMDKNTVVEVYEYMVKFQSLFSIDQSIIDKLREIIKCKFNDLIVYNLQPSIQDLFESNIYVLDVSGTKKYIPLWHNELHFNDCIVYINPELPEHIDIDDDNNINICIHMTQSELFSGEVKKINVYGNIYVDINPNKLFCKKFQKVVFKGKGISRINEKNIFNHDIKSDIIVNINTV